MNVKQWAKKQKDRGLSYWACDIGVLMVTVVITLACGLTLWQIPLLWFGLDLMTFQGFRVSHDEYEHLKRET